MTGSNIGTVKCETSEKECRFITKPQTEITETDSKWKKEKRKL